MIEMFTIRHNPTGHYLPNPRGNRGRGGSHVEPVEPNPVQPPRLFHNKAAAKIALSHWLKGALTVSYFGDDEDWHLEPKPHRKREDMEVVPVNLELPQ